MTETVTHCTACGNALPLNPRRKGTLCKPCNSRAVARSPEKREKCRAAMKKRFEDPNYRFDHLQAMLAGQRRAMQNPEHRAMLREQGRKVAALGATRRHGPGSPARLAAGRTRTETVLGLWPPEYRDDYRYLRITKLLRAPEARAIIEDQIAADLEAYRRTGKLQQSARRKAK